jgi:microcystin-dependent protein
LEDTAIPSDSNGVYSLPSGYKAVTGEVIQASQHNPPLEDLESAISQRLMRSGVAPMTGPLKIVDGAVGSPAVKFSTDGSTGFYKTTGGIGVSVGGTKVAEFTSSGISRMIGELIPWTLLSAPSGWVLPYGQTLSRTTYADLWTIAQDEISNGNTFFNNGDGSTTFGIGDLRGRVVAGRDGMGGTLANRLSGGAPGVDGSTLGATGGTQTVALTQTQLPNVNFTVTIPAGQGSHTHTSDGIHNGATTPVSGTGFSAPTSLSTATISPATLPAMSGTAASGGSGTSHNNVQPTMICNYILYAGA